MRKFSRPIAILVIQGILLTEVMSGVIAQSWQAVIAAVVTLTLTFLPQHFVWFFGIELPRSLLSGNRVFHLCDPDKRG